MPVLLPILASAGAAIGAAGAAIGGFLGTTFLGIKLGTWVAASLLVHGHVKQRRAQKRARNAYNDGLTDRTVTFTDANAPWQVVYGEAVVGGRVVAQLTSGDRDQYQHVVVVWADHECHSIPDVLLAGVPLGALDSDGYVTSGKYFKTGTDLETATVTLDGSGACTLPEVPVSVLGMSYTTGSGSTAQDVTLPGSEVIESGGTTVTVKPEHVAAWAGRTVRVSYRVPFQQFFRGGSTGSNASVRVRSYLGTAGQAADALTITECPGDWSSTDRLAGKCYSIFRFTLDEPEFQGGPPLIQARLRGKKLYDHRTDTTVWSANPALCLADFLVSEYGKGQPSNAVLWDSVDAAANVCDEVVTLTAGVVVTGPRYTCNGSFTTDTDADDTLVALADSMAGFATFTGAWHVQAGAWGSPAIVYLTDADNMGSVEVVECPDGQEMVNGLRGQFFDKDRFGQRTDYSPYSNAAFVTADGGEVWGTLHLPFTDTNWRTTMLARIQVERSRAQQIVYPAKLRALRVRVGQRVSLTNSLLNLDNAIYRLVRKQFRIGGPVMMTLVQDDASMYDLVDAPGPLPSPTAPTRDPWVVEPVVGLTGASNESVVVRDDDGTVISRATLAWAATTDPYVLTGGALQIELRLAADTAWGRLADVAPNNTSIALPGLQDRRYYLVRARWANALGKVGDWASISLITAAPSDLSAVGAAAALAAAEAAQDSADAANAALSDIANDNMLTRGEKPRVKLDHAAITGEKAGIDAAAAAYDITTERTAYNSAVSALASYLGGLTPAWDDTTQNTPITRSAFQAAFAGVYSARQVLLNKVAQVAGTRAAWASITGLGKPADNATRGKNLALPFAQWALAGQPLATVSDGKVGPEVLRLFGGGYPNMGIYVPIDRSKTYRTRFWARPSADAAGVLYFSLQQFTDAVGNVGPVNGGRSPYKPGGVGRAAHEAAAGGSYAWLEYSFTWDVSDWQAGVTHVRPDFLDNYSLQSGWWEVQDFTFEEVTEVVAAQAAASTAATAASNAQTAANTANTALANIASDNVLTRGEKPAVILDWTVIAGEQAGIDARAVAYGITTEVSAYDSAITALATYLDSLWPAWNDLSQDTPITGTTFRASFAAVYSTRQALLNQIVVATLAAAAADATSKANAANTAAQTAAALDAQARASLAEVTAKAYADGIVSDEEARAIADATTKANAARIAAEAAAAADATAKANAAALTSLWSGVSGSGRPADNATVNRVSYSATAPSSPVDGDVWVDTSAAPAVTRLRVAGSWLAGANLSTGALAQLDAVNTAQISSGAVHDILVLFDATGHFESNAS